MKWFKRLFLEKCEKQIEVKPSTSKVDPLLGKFNSLNFTTYVMPDPAEEVFETPVVECSEVCALTTIKNFRADTLDEFVFESDWMFVDRQRLLEPKFQQHLAKSDSLTALCKMLAKRNSNKLRAEVVARSPCCHCQDLRSQEGEIKLRVNTFRRFVNAIGRFCKRLCNKFKNCIICNKKKARPYSGPKSKIESDRQNFTMNYLCR